MGKEIEKYGYARLAVLTSILILIALSGFPALIHEEVTAAPSATVITSLPYTIVSSGVYILESDLTSTGDGITVLASDVVILGNGHTISGSSTGTAIYIDGSYNVTIQDLGIEGFDYGINISYVYGGSEESFTGIRIKNISISSVNIGITVSSSYYGVLIEDIIIEDIQDYGIYSKYNEGLYIKNATIVGSNGLYDDYGIYSFSDSGVYVYGCHISNTTHDGIEINQDYNTMIAWCTIENAMSEGITVYNAYATLIYSSSVLNSSEYGIFVSSSYFTIILDSLIMGSGFDGIYIYDSNYNNVSDNVIRENGGNGVYLDEFTDYTMIYSNSIVYNNDYGVASYTDYYFEVAWNTFGDNGVHPQALDFYSVGYWHDNFWSDRSGPIYSLDGNTDPSPMDDPMTDILITGVSSPTTTQAGNLVRVNVTLTNYGYAGGAMQLRMHWSGSLEFQQVPYVWIDVDPYASTTLYGGEELNDYGNYTLWDEDDEYFIYKLPWPISIYGYEYNYIVVSTNGYVELSTQPFSLLSGDNTVHSFGEHRVWRGVDAYGFGITVLFAYSGDLAADPYVGIFNLGDKIVVVFNGTTYEDWDPTTAPVQYEIILGRDGSITITLGDINYGYLYGDAYTGIYLQPVALEIPAGYRLPPYTSWSLTPSSFISSNELVNVPVNSSVSVTLEWPTSLLPHYSPFTLWINGNPYVFMFVYTPPSVGGEIVVHSDGTLIATIAVASAAVAGFAYLLLRRRFERSPS